MSNMLVRAHRAAGDLVSGVVLLRLAFRYGQSMKAGKAYTAQSYSHLMEETGCTFKQVKRAISVLKTRGLITAEQHLFGGKNIGHYALTAVALKALEGQPGMTLEGVLACWG